MDKETVLRKAQTEKQDERTLQVKDKSFQWIYLTMGIAAAVFSLIRAMRGQPIMDLCATVCISVCVGMLYRYFRTRETSCLAYGIVLFIVAAAATVRFFMGH